MKVLFLLFLLFFNISRDGNCNFFSQEIDTSRSSLIGGLNCLQSADPVQIALLEASLNWILHCFTISEKKSVAAIT